LEEKDLHHFRNMVVISRRIMEIAGGGSRCSQEKAVHGDHWRKILMITGKRERSWRSLEAVPGDRWRRIVMTAGGRGWWRWLEEYHGDQ
jgi:hypothetical protein